MQTGYRSGTIMSLVLCALCGNSLSSPARLLANGIDVASIPASVVDDVAAHKTGTWSTSTRVTPFVGEHYLYAKNGSSIEFTFEVEKEGVYHVLASYTPHPNRTSKAQYTLQGEGAESRVFEIDQRQQPQHRAGFQPLGKVELAAGTCSVTLVAENADGAVVADAVALVADQELAVFNDFQPRNLVARNKGTPQAPVPTTPVNKPAAQSPGQYPPNALRTLTPDALERMLAERLGPVDAGQRVDDPTYLRRITLDIVGRVPSPEELSAFLSDPAPDRRERAVERLLLSPQYGANWARYWGDVIRYRVPNPQLTFLNYEPFEQWLAEQFNQDRRWDEITYDILTAKGKVGEHPAATFVGFHQADTSRLASETSRVFLAVNIQCAECHDHKFIDMPQRTFHEFAAYFARADAKLPWNDSNQIEVKSKDKGEYRMPGSKEMMQPVAFGRQQLELGQSDLQRRAELARWVVNPTNPWFARAYVNRIWARFMGQGFCEPVDEIGELAVPVLPEVHQALGDHFAASGFDTKDLVRLITATSMYQRKAGVLEPSRPFRAAVAQRLRADEVFDSLTSAIELPNYTPPASEPTGAVRFPPPPKSTRDLVDIAYGFDPSLAREQVVRTMRQAMFMMNNEQIQRQIDGTQDADTVLARLLREQSDNARLIEQLFLRTLGRKPSEREATIALQHIESVADRTEAFEDLLWSLLNSAEFTTRA